MKVAIPTGFIGGLEDEIFPHFGKAPTFTLVDIKENMIKSTEIIKNNGEHFGGLLTPSDILLEKNIQALICLGAGPRALEKLRSQKVEIYVTMQGHTKEAIEYFIKGKLHKMSNDEACRDHMH
ncbi:MAG: Dinitrogenase iron-molybdenum cofactor [Candidatus Methanofastidiosum methylothiophilum]|uniref:Dinitrogenase iron-molybdenum cofactor n=1 Tax=Candidatus Methanofastidiosum methylothiophilum TaxID=1705564 RepID=A0A150INP4_9EURY|nr:MAG: Dinitrogenase iron-molybdenum cofactor [Candidatus Methanofastidiosum methylthiophilus]KYC46472.1 MAG: Dinitrogenase iron-molybdenum cofactor [Candidatus Methanofastidiosum methylthiophilus]KYC49036.1 MAG: Dinitrogenase iron-molybdenum cofactor [Candidatus Methanofastidiosum methylthiophilus]